MLKKDRLFTPGPTPLLPQAQRALAAADIHHRTAEFRALYTRVLSDLQAFIGTRNEVIVMASSGTGAMEAAVQNLTSPGDKVVVLMAGKFGERWRDLARAYGCDTDVLTAPDGETFALDAVRARLAEKTPRVVFMQATESSTGARHDVRGIAELLRGTDTLLVIDAITGLGTTQFDVDAWGVDIIIGGSQKALMVPAGVAYCAVSERAWQRMEHSKTPRYYFDLRRARKAGAAGESPFTPAIANIAAMGAALEYIRAMGNGDLVAGRDALIRNAELAAAMTRAAVQALGLKLFAPNAPAAALTSIASPAGMDSAVIVKAMRARFGAVIASGQGDMKSKLLRIAHIGYYDYLDTIGVLGALEHVLISVGVKCELGAGLKAAQAVFAAQKESAAVNPQSAKV